MNLFISNLDKSITTQELQVAFEDYGASVDAVLLQDDGRAYARAQVRVEPDDSARAAIEELNYAPLRGRPIKVRECVPRARRERRLRRDAVAVERRDTQERRTQSI